MEKEKKEIWMEKLIRFINEYGHTNNCWPFQTCRIEPATEWNSSYLVLSRDDNWEWDWKDWHLEVPRLISKEYLFIKWLVENDKINWRKCLDLWYEISVIDEEWEDVDIMRTFDSYEQLLMYLSIQDNPIEFLVSILK